VIVSVVAVELQVRRSAACVRSTALHVHPLGAVAPLPKVTVVDPLVTPTVPESAAVEL
jgi:hypothetical protein